MFISTGYKFFSGQGIMSNLYQNIFSINSFTHKSLMQVDWKNVFMLANRILFLKLISCVQLIEMPKEHINKMEGKNISESWSENDF